MTFLLVPAAGLSTRYGLSRPKFLLQHPAGGTMLGASISCLGNLLESGVSRVLVVSLADYFRDLSSARLADEIEQQVGVEVRFELLPSPTGSMVETICRGLDRAGDDAPFIVKDSDNALGLNLRDLTSVERGIAYGDLRTFPQVTAHNKSFLSFGADRTLNSIIEKRITGPFINVGCLKFASASEFLAAAKAVGAGHEIYVSDVVRVMLDWGQLFHGIEIDAYEDWGTLDEWLRFVDSFRTFFIDLDGVLVENENPLALSGGWSRMRPIQENLNALREVYEGGRARMVFTTTRAERFREEVASSLRSLGFHEFDLVMGLPHARRVLINDFAVTNPYPSAEAINVPRNATNLRDYL